MSVLKVKVASHHECGEGKVESLHECSKGEVIMNKVNYR